MRIQFEALSAFTFLVGVVFGFIGSNDALTRPFQDRNLPVIEGVPRHTRCITGPFKASDKSFGDVNAPPYFTRCTTEPYGPAPPDAGSRQRPSLAKNNPYAVNAPYEPELSQSPDFARRPTLTFVTERPTPPFFKGKPGEGQTAQITFGFRAPEMNQLGPHFLFNQFHPFQRTKEYWLSIDESEFFPPINRHQDFLNKNVASEPSIKSDNPSRRHKFPRSISENGIPNHFLGYSPLQMQHEKMRQKEEFRSSGGNITPLSLPPPAFPEYPSLPFFSEEDQEEDEEEEEHPNYPEFTSRFLPQEQAISSLNRYTSPEERRFHQYTSPIFPQPQEYTSPTFFPQEPRTAFFQYHYSKYVRPATVSFVESDQLPFTKSPPFNREQESLAGDPGLVQTQMMNGRSSWYDEANDVNEF